MITNHLFSNNCHSSYGIGWYNIDFSVINIIYKYIIFIIAKRILMPM